MRTTSTIIGGKKGKHNAFTIPNQPDGRSIGIRPNLAQRLDHSGRKRNPDATPARHDDDLGAIRGTEQNPNTDRQRSGTQRNHSPRPAKNAKMLKMDVLDVALPSNHPGRISGRSATIHPRSRNHPGRGKTTAQNKAVIHIKA